ncbi:MAG: hypothetical protein QME55_10700 [Brevundimonas sp.]|uniref:hypothetical protein n=1 Tax=Brevundimonas sp. TaxID=1871086 RepID=UPI00261DA40B|nr:hypothetical protein [Brevundimonas sp.]MDI6625186.1 hypothetical protein [Brevundimonas sp.]MDQ7813556.1 hypothetical protein [Brevundimonas sp.]
MKVLRFVVVLAVLAYAGWLAWPFLSPFFEGAGPEAATMRARAEAEGGGALFGFLPAWTLWAGAIVLYVISALMLGAGNSKSAVAYFLAFLADAALRLALDQQGGDAARTGPATMSAPEAASSLPMDPIWLTLGALVVLGLLVVVAGRRIRRARTPGQLAY